MAKAEATRRRALSPFRIVLRLATIPVLAVTVTLSLFLKTSEYPPVDALRHLVAMAGCSAAEVVDLAPARDGDIGYHARNDPEGDGIACGTGQVAVSRSASGPVSVPVSEPASEPQSVGAETPSVRMEGGAKFLRP